MEKVVKIEQKNSWFYLFSRTMKILRLRLIERRKPPLLPENTHLQKDVGLESTQKVAHDYKRYL